MSLNSGRPDAVGRRPYRQAMEHGIYRPDERPDIEVLVDGVWCEGEYACGPSARTAPDRATCSGGRTASRLGGASAWRSSSSEPNEWVHTGGVVYDSLLVGICALISIALVVALVFQWRDDHKGLGRRMH